MHHKEGLKKFTAQRKPYGHWRRAAMSVSFFLVLLATIFVILLSRGVDKELDFFSLRSDVHQQAEKILIHLIEMRIAEQNYKITNSPIFYKRYIKAENALKDVMAHIALLSIAYPELKEWLTLLHREISTRNALFHEHQNTHERAQKENLALAKKEAKHDQDLATLMRLIAYSLNNEKTMLIERRHGLDMLRAALSFAAIITMVSTFLLAYAVYDRFRRDMQALREYQKKLQQDNLLLEERVQERTKALEEAHNHAEKERKRAEVLLQDASHRIGNSLATVSSLLRLQASKNENDEVRSALLSAHERIQNISAAHRRLRLGKDQETAAIDELLEFIVQDAKNNVATDLNKRINIHTYLEPWLVNARDATTLAIITAELLTNTFKHAFPENREGNIFIYFGKNEKEILSLIVEDDGIGIPALKENGYAKDIFTNCSEKTFGLGLMVAKQLCAQFDAEPYAERPESGGTRFIVPLPGLKGKYNPKPQSDT